MTQVLVLTGAPNEADVSDALCGDVQMAVESAGGQCEFSAHLKVGCAAELSVRGLSDPAFQEVLAHFGEKVPVDFNLVPANQRKKGLLIADMDSTIITTECIDELADFVGLKDVISDITERAMRGELEFESALRQRVALLKGLQTSLLPQVFQERISLTPGAKALVATMKASGAFTALISGGFSFFTGKVAALVGFQFEQANLLLEEDGRLTGFVGEPVLGRDAKKSALISFREEHCLNAQATMAVGDGANDLAMIEEAGLGVAFRAKPLVADAAPAAIQHGDLTALLYLQGYTDEEIVDV
jgi:phosphoserine phosphatase